ncbi:hypothetical protein FRX31_005483 [Thalictrum thalictroides]|uniref:Uncharacterized protein n=1 Tax=Thalictrum thalictroides TaxID=46969 RepID=A0A7J6X6A9_THATH|nr:hypothetical protein FRX31_005483 [Thalictrum thalictroides]
MFMPEALCTLCLELLALPIKHSDSNMNVEIPRSNDRQKAKWYIRCSATFMVDITKNMKVEIPDSHKETVSSTPFGRLFNFFLERRVRKETNISDK